MGKAHSCHSVPVQVRGRLAGVSALHVDLGDELRLFYLVGRQHLYLLSDLTGLHLKNLYIHNYLFYSCRLTGGVTISIILVPTIFLSPSLSPRDHTCGEDRALWCPCSKQRQWLTAVLIRDLGILISTLYFNTGL